MINEQAYQLFCYQRRIQAEPLTEEEQQIYDWVKINLTTQQISDKLKKSCPAIRQKRLTMRRKGWDV